MNRFTRRLLGTALALAALAALAPAAVAAGPQAPDPAFETAQPYEGTWYGRFGATNCSWIVLGDGVFVIDTGATAADARNLKAEIARTTGGKPVKWIAMTHLHGDSNDGFAAFLPTEATIFLNVKVAAAVLTSFGTKPTAPQVVAITDRVVVSRAGKVIEIGALAQNAHTGSDLYVFDAAARTAWVGDLVTPGRCPMLSDPDSDIKGWLVALDKIEALKPAALVTSRANPTATAAAEITRTRRYLASMLQFLVEKKKQNAPEARVSGELAGEKIADYCPRELAALNALSVYRRMAPDGSTAPGSTLPPKPATK